MVGALQEVFKSLGPQSKSGPGRTNPLTTTMKIDVRIQQDIQEFNRWVFNSWLRMRLVWRASCHQKLHFFASYRLLMDGLSSASEKVKQTIDAIFLGKLQNYIQTIHIPFEKHNEELFYDLSLNVKGYGSVEESLEEYIEEELLDGDNQYRVEKHGLQDAVKGVRFLQLPPVLQLHLKRYDYDMEQDQMVKVADAFEFSRELDTSTLLPGKDSKYVLQAVVIHRGNSEAGHYYTYIDPKCDGKWYCFDDTRVWPVDETQVYEDGFGGSVSRAGVSNTAYMLQYVKKSAVDSLLTGKGGQEACPAEEKAPPAG